MSLRRFLHDAPIRRKLTVITMLTSCAALLLACISFAAYERESLKRLMVRDLDTRLALTQENTSLRNGNSLSDRDRVALLNRRLQQETAEKDRLRKELEEARAKLEAIAALEGGPAERKP